MKSAAFVLATALVATPLQAAEGDYIRHGAFVGARLTVGGKSGTRPSAALSIAPIQNRRPIEGALDRKIGEGIALNFGTGSKPTLTLAGIRADHALGLRSSSEANADGKLGISTSGWIALGVGALLVGGGLYAYHIYEEAEENTE